jgi:superfamily II DNA or RNA helicase
MEAFSSLQDWLSREAWMERFDEEHLLGMRKWVNAISDLEAEVIDEDNVIVRATVKDKPVAELEISFWQTKGAWELESDCSCQIVHLCPHAAGLLCFLGKKNNLLRLLEGRVSRKSALPDLPRAADLLRENEDLPTLVVGPRFSIEVTREPIVDKRSVLVAKYLGEASPSEWVVARAYATYETYRFPLFSTLRENVSEVRAADGSLMLVRRDRSAELVAALQLRQIGLSGLDESPTMRFLASGGKGVSMEDHPWLPPVSPSLSATYWQRFRAEHHAFLTQLGWEVSISSLVGHMIYESSPEDWSTSLHEVDDMPGWFSVSVGFDLCGKLHDLLPILAKLLEEGFLEETLDRPDGGYALVPMANGDALKIPIGRVRVILRHLVAMIDPVRGSGQQVHALDAAALSRIAELEINTPPSLLALREKLDQFSGIEACHQPDDLRATMRDYQLAGFRWMQFLSSHGLHGILADDMGLGKTLQTIAHLLEEKNHNRNAGLPSLVVAPTSVVPNWRAEALRFAPTLRILVLNGAERKKYYTSIPYADVVITSYALLQRDAEILRRQPFHLMVLDEAQYIKNPRALVAQAACKMNARHRICLSGTPVENHLGELWSLMRFLMPGFLGNESDFQSRFRKPIEKQGDTIRMQALKNRVAPLILRRTKDQVAKELPPKTILVHFIELTTAQKDLYETIRATMDKRVRDAIAARGMEQSQIVFLDALLKLRQLCCHPALLPAEFSSRAAPSAKLQYTLELIETQVEEGRRILLFSQFTSMLELIRAELEKRKIAYLLLTGASKDRGALVDAFQKGNAPIFLISLKAGGTGLNLTAADTVIHYDPWWNPAAEAQATDRAYRIGQEKPVFVHKLLCENTVEQRIHLLQQEKAGLANQLLDNADRSVSLDHKTLQSLLAPLGS